MSTQWLKRVVPRLLGTLILTLAIILPIVIGVAQVHADSVDLYWYPVTGSGTGNWSTSGAGGHWATASDGTGLGHTAPTSTNNVFFTSTSFTGAGQTVTVDALADCASMTWTGATNNPTFANNSGIQPRGDITFIAAMTVSVSQILSYRGGLNAICLFT